MILRLNRYQFFLRLTMFVLPAIAMLFAIMERYALPLRPISYDWHYLIFGLVLTAIWAIVAPQQNLCSVEHLMAEQTGLRRTLAASTAVATLMGLILYLIRETTLSRLFVGLTCVTLFLTSVVIRFAFREAMRRALTRGRPLRVLMIGTDHYARRIERRLRETPVASCSVLGYVHLPGQAITVHSAKVYEVDEIESIDPAEIDDVIVAVNLEQYSKVSAIMNRLQRLCRPVRAVMDFGKNVAVQITPLRFGRLQLMDLGTMPVETVQYQFVKRTFDIAFSLLVLFVVGPLMLLIAAAIKITSPGPVFFRQDRVGFNGERFQMLKFRSMCVNNETAFTSASDPRITTIGRILRKTSLDELPQFLNVLAGDMSVVGPRPEQTFFVHKFRTEIPTYMSRHTIKCGITGWAQVNGLRGSGTSIPKRVQYDLEYIRNWSLGLDLRIIMLTILTGFAGKNAY